MRNLKTRLCRRMASNLGTLRFGITPCDNDDIRDLRYDTIADGNRNLHNDMWRLGNDWKKAINNLNR